MIITIPPLFLAVSMAITQCQAPLHWDQGHKPPIFTACECSGGTDIKFMRSGTLAGKALINGARVFVIQLPKVEIMEMHMPKPGSKYGKSVTWDPIAVKP